MGLASQKGDDAKPPPSLTVGTQVVKLVAFVSFQQSDYVFFLFFFFSFGRDLFFPTGHSGTFTERIGG